MKKELCLCRYHNHEAIPEQVDVKDFFQDTTLFKISPAFNPALRQPDNFVSSLTQIPPTFFHFYSNGKSAAKVTESLHVRGVHNFGLPRHAIKATAPLSQVVLHYPCCGFDHFWDKYNTLGRFGDAWYGKVDIRSRTSSTHLDSRDVVTMESIEEARRFYKHRFVIDTPEISDALIKRGYCTRISHVQDVLQQ